VLGILLQKEEKPGERTGGAVRRWGDGMWGSLKAQDDTALL
jgi:hypothetical protein